ncbi:HD-GYP domain-containing protein (plasmid) [Rossellomorea sp. AcN35-11]|nr:HD-GYP domain-containing protein [Rossellomorea aquimaris]WJV32231.1 HD-GYP domain-containing protein [Rossellomorea sp. AcN35-11]
MRLIELEKSETGVELVGTVFQGEGDPVFERGIVLTKGIKKLLLENGVCYIYVEEKNRSKDAVINDEDIESVKRGFFDILHKNKKAKTVSKETLIRFQKVLNELFRSTPADSGVMNILAEIQKRDEELCLHSINVTLYSMQLAKDLDYSIKDTELIGMGALLHDIGKMLIPRAILYNSEGLKDGEFQIIKTHSSLGFEVLKDNYFIPEEAAQTAYQHHERLDGSGYPRGLKNDDIHEFAKIIAVSDVYDAVTSDRVYQKAMLPHEGVEVLRKSIPQQLDSRLVETFPRSITIYPPGTSIILNHQQKAVVLKYNSENPGNPIVSVLSRKDGTQLEESLILDLSKSSNYKITSAYI